MPTLADFSLSNLQIKQYFEGSDAYLPTAELLYIHSHPLVRPNFLVEIESLINQASQVMQARKIVGTPVDKFVTLAKNLGVALPALTEANAPQVLATLRDIYKLCTAITGMR